MRPQDDDVVPMREALLWQREYVVGHGAPVAGLILDAVLADLDAGGPLAARLPQTARFGDLPGLRVMATVHRLALERRAPAVALALPTLGGTPPDTPRAAEYFRTAVLETLVDHPDDLARGLLQTPQTNEVGRAALLRSALSRLVGPDATVRLWEIGASGGLNLRADHLPGDARLEPRPLPAIVERRGCDIDPIDVATVEGRLLLSSYVWVDDVERFHRLSQAFEVAALVPATVVRMDAADFVRDLHPRRGDVTVLWHSAMWVYLPPRTRTDVLGEIERAGLEADADAPVLHVSWEWDAEHGGPDQFALTVRRWDGVERGAPVVLARGQSHGRDVSISAE